MGFVSMKFKQEIIYCSVQCAPSVQLCDLLTDRPTHYGF